MEFKELKMALKGYIVFLFPLFFLLMSSFLSQGCGFRSIPMANNEVEASWSEVQNQYKRRSDLIPNLVNTVKAYAAHEKETFERVIKARAEATKTNINFKNLSAASLKQFQVAQGALSQALSRLMVVVERYPDLKSNQNFRDLQVQLEGTENRIAIARRRYIESIKKFNNFITAPPESIVNSLFLKHEKKPQFSVENFGDVKKVPDVKF